MAPQKSLTGMWQKDKEASDSMDPACELMQLGWVVRTAMKVISRMQVRRHCIMLLLCVGGVSVSLI